MTPPLNSDGTPVVHSQHSCSTVVENHRYMLCSLSPGTYESRRINSVLGVFPLNAAHLFSCSLSCPITHHCLGERAEDSTPPSSLPLFLLTCKQQQQWARRSRSSRLLPLALFLCLILFLGQMPRPRTSSLTIWFPLLWSPKGPVLLADPQFEEFVTNVDGLWHVIAKHPEVSWVVVCWMMKCACEECFIDIWLAVGANPHPHP